MSSIETIYKYTEALLKEQESSLLRLDAKATVLIAFAGTIAKTAMDIESSSIITFVLCGHPREFRLSWVVYIFSSLTVLCASLGVTAKTRGKAVDPSELMEDEWFQEEEEYHQGYIISGWIETMKECRHLAEKKIKRLNITVIFFNISFFTLIAMFFAKPYLTAVKL
jgi:hypothetical protein